MEAREGYHSVLERENGTVTRGMVHLIGLAGVLAIAFAAIFVRLADVSPATATFFRTLYALPILFIIARMTRHADRRSVSARRLAAASGLLLAADLTLWHESIARIGAGLGTVLANIQVIFVGAAAWILHRERPTLLAVAVIPVVLAGVMLVSGLGRPDAYGSDPAGGVIFGIFSAAAYAAYLLQIRAANRTLSPSAGPLLDATAGAAIGALVTAPLDPRFSFAFAWPAHGWLMALAIVCQVGGWLLIGTALPRLAALETSILLLAQPIGTLLLSMAFFDERLSSVQWMGVALVMVGIAALTMGKSVKPRKEKAVLFVLPFTFFLSSCAPVRPVSDATGELARLERIARRVTIHRDAYGVPHIYGPTDASVVFGLMYAQAEDNFWQIEEDYIRRLGRAAEVHGEAQLAGDALLRAFDDGGLAREEYARSQTPVRAIADAFADGLNYFLLTRPDVRPRLIQRFEPWHVFAGRIPRTARVDGVRLDAQWGAAPPEPTEAQFDEGSNTWALSPTRSASGRALLFINPHVGFFGGGQRYELHLHSGEGWHFSGFAILGYPVPRAGHNEHLGWSHTNTDADTSDLYLETFDHPTDPLSYRYGDGYRRATTWTDVVRVKRGDRIEERAITFTRTHHGPVVGERDGRKLTARFATVREGGGIAQWYDMGRARTLADFKRALARRAFYISNTMYADREGNIFYIHGNAVPKRSTRFDWTKPVEGRDPATEWNGYHAIDDLPQLTNPASGYLQNCNSTPFQTTDGANPERDRYPKYMTQDRDTPRAVASRRILSGDRIFTFDEWARAAFDTRVAVADQGVPAILDAWNRRETPGLSSADRLAAAVDLLRTWDRVSRIDSVPMTLFVLAQERMNGGAAPLEALARGVAELERTHGTWRVPWGDLNRLQRVHTAGQETFRDDRPSVPVAGAPGWAGLVFTFVSAPVAGATRRYGLSGHTYVAVVEFGRPVRARSLLVFGQSGDPSSAHYFDQAPLYSRGAFKPAWFSRGEVRAAARRTYHPGEM